MKEIKKLRKGERFIKKFLVSGIVLVYILFSIPFYKSPGNFYSVLLKDSIEIKQYSPLKYTFLSELLPSPSAVLGKYKKVLFLQKDQRRSWTGKILLIELNFCGYFSYFLPAFFLQRSVYFSFFSIPIIFIFLLYIAKLVKAKSNKFFITNPIARAFFVFLQSVIWCTILIFCAVPITDPKIGVALMYLLPFVYFKKNYYSGAWLWIRR